LKLPAQFHPAVPARLAGFTTGARAARRWFGAGWLAVWILGAVTAGASSFGPPMRLADSGGAIASTAADLNKDGRLEFISAASKESGGRHFRIYFWQTNSQSFATFPILPGTNIANRLDRFAGDLAIGDLNNDGWPDIVVPESNNADGPGQVSWFQNPGGNLGGTWIEHVISTWSGAVGDRVEHLCEAAVGDINRDGWADIVVRDASHGCYLLLRDNTGTGWETRRFLPVNPREGLALWNPDGDGDLDILLNGVWLETPDDPLNDAFVLRTFAAPWYPAANTGPAVNDYASKVLAADFNGDGRDDIAITNAEELSNDSSTSAKPNGVRLYLAPPDPVNGAWTEVILDPLGFSWHTLDVADVDRDGDLDLVSGISQVGVDNTPGKIVAFLNDGTGTAFAPQVIASGLDSLGAEFFLYNATLADADGDGDADLFAPDNWNSGPIRYFENLTPPPDNMPATPANLTGTPLSSSRIELAWEAPAAGQTGFKIERRAGDEEEFAEIAQTGGGVTAFEDTGLTPEAEYTYRVRAFNAYGDSPTTDEVPVSTPPDLYYYWQENYFGADPDANVAGDWADPDRDSIPNLLEYFHGTNPNLAQPGGLSLITGTNRLTAGFKRNSGVVDVTAVVQAADSLNGPWTDIARSTTGGPFVPLVAGVEASETGVAAIRNVRVGDSVLFTDPARPARFLRLRLFR
jgi:hypothetical protein